MEGPIETARLTLRPLTADDAEAAFELFRTDEVGRFTGGAHGSLDETRELIARGAAHQAEHGFAMWGVWERDTGLLVGEVGLQLLEHRGPDIEIGWSIRPERWRRGYAYEAARAWLDAAFGELGLGEVVAVVRTENAPSRALAERLGLRHAGKRAAYDHELELYVARAPRA
jgi:RimJ/RimL family protein N-acetyltransferase